LFFECYPTATYIQSFSTVNFYQINTFLRCVSGHTSAGVSSIGISVVLRPAGASYHIMNIMRR